MYRVLLRYRLAAKARRRLTTRIEKVADTNEKDVDGVIISLSMAKCYSSGESLRLKHAIRVGDS